jgi:PAS domain S-box-containing protein
MKTSASSPGKKRRPPRRRRRPATPAQAPAPPCDSEERNRALLDNAPVGIFEATAAGKMLYANAEYARMLGYDSPKQILAAINRRGVAAVLYTDPALRAKWIRETLASGKWRRYENIYRRKDGSLMVGALMFRAVRLAPGKVRLLGFVEDVTQRRRTEEALRAGEQRYRLLVETMNEGLIVVDKDMQMTLVNDRFCRMLGYARHQLIGRRGTILLDAANRKIARHQLRLRARGTIGPYELAFVHQDGRRVYCLVSPNAILDPADQFSGSISVVTDITQIKQTEEALRDVHAELELRVERRTAELARANEFLRESEAKYRTLVESTREAISTIDANGAFLFMNSTAALRLGGRPADFVGKTLWDVFPKDVADRHAGFVRQVIRTRRGMDTDSSIKLQGRRRWYRATLEPLADGSGKVRAALVVASDQTARKATEEALRLARQKLAVAREEERRHLSRELHDSIGQKLIAAGMRLQSLSQDIAPAPQSPYRQALDEVSRQFQELSQEVRHASRTLYPPTLESLGLASALRQLRSDMQSGGIQVSVRCARALEQARFAPEVEIAFFRIAQEALANAFRHGKCRRVSLELGLVRGQLRLAIVDDGKGFRPDKPRGQGLGLTSMRERAEAIGAELRLTSKPGRTCVAIRAAKPAPAPRKIRR